MAIDYQALLDEAMLNLVKKVLLIVQKEGLNSDNHFYISFYTKSDKVTLSNKMKERYPEEITIVLQHQFESLKVQDDGFFVLLSFDGVYENVFVPFISLTTFVDPSGKFSLQFKSSVEEELPLISSSTNAQKLAYENDITSQKQNKDIGLDDNVIDMSKFRKKK